MTEEQRDYALNASTGKLGDLLALITEDVGRRKQQAYCTVNNGFLAWGREIVPTGTNRIRLRTPNRCTNFGTDAMAGMMEWLGRQVHQNYTAEEYSGVRLTVGDVSAPRGGCLSGSSGRRGHASHTAGQDADVGFIFAKPGLETPMQFHRDFDLKSNWWFLKKVFENPFACVKVIFLDKRIIRRLNRYAAHDPDWAKYGRFIRHMPGHGNHFHIRIGEEAGLPGCSPDARPELEMEEDVDALQFLEESRMLEGSEDSVLGDTSEGD